MLARPAPAAPAAGALARLDAGETLIDVGDKSEPSHLAIGDDVDAALCLPAHDLRDRALDPPRIELRIERRTLLLRQDHRQQIGRPRQTADMGGQYPLRAVLHKRLPRCSESLALLELTVDSAERPRAKAE